MQLESTYTQHHPHFGEGRFYTDGGYVHYGVDNRRMRVFIHNVEVEPAHRKQGIGLALVEAVSSAFPSHLLDFGYTTDEGEMLRQAWLRKNGIGPTRLERTWGSHDLDTLFPRDEDGPAISTSVPWPRKSGTREKPAPYNSEHIRRAMAHPEHRYEDLDPRTLHASQPGLTRSGVSYYMGDDYARSGKTYADQDKSANQYPIVYTHKTGESVIAAGHHRAAVALLRGEPLTALHVKEADFAGDGDTNPVRGRDAEGSDRPEGGHGPGGSGSDQLGAHRRTASGGMGDGARDAEVDRTAPGMDREPAHEGTGVNGPDEMPPAMGESPIPEGTIRCYHNTWGRHIPGIRNSGLLESHAKGDGGLGAGNEPSAGVWAATGHPAGDDKMQGPPVDSDRHTVEFWAHPHQISTRAEHHWNNNPEQWGKGYHHVIMNGDVPKDQIVAIHEPWHSATRYMADSADPEKEYGWIRDSDDRNLAHYKKGLDYLAQRKQAVKNADVGTAPGEEVYPFTLDRVHRQTGQSAPHTLGDGHMCGHHLTELQRRLGDQERSGEGEHYWRVKHDTWPLEPGTGTCQTCVKRSVDDIFKEGNWLPTERVFGPTKETLDPRLFDGEQMKPGVRQAVLSMLDQCMTRHDLPDWQHWLRVFLAGSESTFWWGNNDFDTLLGCDYAALKRAHSEFAGIGVQAISDTFNAWFRAELNNEDWQAPWDIDGGLWHLTFYLNPMSWDIREIKPYGAYSITDDGWVVRPPLLPNHKPEDFNHSVYALAEKYADRIRHIVGMPPGPRRRAEARALLEFLHSDRGRAFSPRGQGWTDPGNLIWKYLDMHPEHLLAELIETSKTR